MAALVVVAMGGCSTYRGSRKTVVVGTWMAGAGVALAGVAILAFPRSGCTPSAETGQYNQQCQLAQLGLLTSLFVVAEATP